MTHRDIGSNLHGFTIKSQEDIPEIEGTAYRMLHEKSGAQLLFLENEDNNKAFSISFKTPAADSTGVFHILEHSVLCGSEKFPVKEPFVNLIKSSMQTFLNAMTFPDKTMYPVASTNEQDLINLIDVYMDAVLNPVIYDKKAIFEQEGWHYEIDEETGDLVYNGVVYNEMKGALSNPDSVLFNGLSAALFPDTTYRFESGGDPKFIPELTYENYLDTHRRHYRLDNSYLTLYGNIDLERFLKFLDTEYLSKASCSVDETNALELQKPVISLDNSVPMTTSKENACVALGYVAGTAHDRDRMIAIDILVDALAGSNEAPLKRAILDSNLAGDFEAYLIDALLQPVLFFQIKNSKPHVKNDFKKLIEQTADELCKKGIDRERLEASLSRAEFVMRERDFDTADGVILAMQSMSGWLYDDNAATDYLRYDRCFRELREKLNDGYFENLLRELVLESDHHALTEIVPVDDLEEPEAARLERIQAGLEENELKTIETEVERLRDLQEKEDTPQALASLPLLQISDIASPPEEQAVAFIKNTPIPCLYHNLPTREIDYLYYYFDFDHLTFEDLPYISLLATLLGKLDTTRYSAEKLDTLIQSRLGGLRFFTEIHESENGSEYADCHFVVATSALSENLSDLCSLPAHIVHSSLFSDTSKIKDILMQQRIAMEQGYIAAGHATAMSRCASYYSQAARIREELSGVNYYLFLKELLNDFEDKSADLVKQLDRIKSLIFDSPLVIASFTGSPEQRDRFWNSFNTCEMNVRCSPVRNRTLTVPELEIKNEAFIVPSDVCYASKGYDRRIIGVPYSGSWQVTGRAVSYDYLWNEVRVKGGAYGAGLRMARTGAMQFYSYRDPQLDETLRRFDQTGTWLNNFDPSESAMRGYLISSTAGHDAPKKSREIARRQDSAFFSKYPKDYRKLIRAEILSTTPEQVQELAPIMQRIADQDCRCVFGSKDILKASRKEWDYKELLK